MRVMVMVKATKASEAGEGLHPSAKGKRVRFAGSHRTVIDRPFTATKELVAGVWLWEVKSMDEAAALKHVDRRPA